MIIWDYKTIPRYILRRHTSKIKCFKMVRNKRMGKSIPSNSNVSKMRVLILIPDKLEFNS